MATGALLHTLEGHAMPVRSLCFSPDSQLLLTASDDREMKIYDMSVKEREGGRKGVSEMDLFLQSAR